MRPHSTVLFAIAAVFLLATACASTPPAATPAAKPAAAPSKPAETAAEPAKPAETPAAPLVAAVPQKPEEAAATVKIVENGKAVVAAFQTVYFDFDKYNIKPEFVPVIKQNADILKKAAALKIVIEGHCDERGTNEYNMALGQRRANAVMKALEAEGVNKDQMKTISYGEERPVDPGHTEEAWAKNRRGVIQNGTGR